MAIKKFIFIFLWVSSTLLSNQVWEKTCFIWNFGLISSCDVGVPPNPKLHFANPITMHHHLYKNIKKGDLVWVSCNCISEFHQKIFPRIQVPFVLVVSDGDASFPSDCLKLDACESMLSDPKVIHIFAQNCDYKGSSKKISIIPIGMDFHTVAYKGTNGGWGVTGSPKQQEALLLNLIKNAPPTNQRKCRAFVDFQHADTMRGEFKRYLQFGEDRTSIFKKILPSGVVDHSKWMSRSQLWQTKINYAFSISPIGNGLDCHRTWEDLVLGCIVIVKTSPIDSLFEGLPVVIIKDWDEINEANFQKWLKQYGDAFTNPNYREKLTNRYWISKMFEVARPFKS